MRVTEERLQGSVEPDAGPGESLTGRAAGLFGVFALFVLIAAFSMTRVIDGDIWWHLASGDLIRATGAVPRAEPFSYTAAGRPYLEIHWLYQVVVSALFAAGGLPLLLAARTTLILALFAALFVRGRAVAGIPATVAVLACATVACHERFLLRPELVSWVFFAASLAILDRAFASGQARVRRALLWGALPLIQIVWVNIQGLFVLGPLVVCLDLAAAVVARLRRSPGAAVREDPALGDRALGVLLVFAACFASPWGWRALVLPFEQFFVHLGGESVISRSIAEFQPPFGGAPLTPPIAAFALLAAATIAMMALARKEARLFDLLVVAAALIAALRARRNIPLFAVAAALPLLRAFAALRPGLARRLRRDLPARARPAVSAVLAAACLGLTFEVVSNRYFARWPMDLFWGPGVVPWRLPEEAARYAAGTVSGNVFHSFTSGGYLVHAWAGKKKVFIDGRNDPYLDGILETYLAAVASPEVFEAVTRRYGVDAVLWPHIRAVEGAALLAHLAAGNGWRLAYLDPAAAVYVRAGGAPPAGAGGDAPVPWPLPEPRLQDLERAIEARPFRGPPLREIALAEFFSVAGDASAAARFYRRAVDREPPGASLLHDAAAALERLGDPAGAGAAHARALALDPGFLPSAAALGALLADEGRFAEAAPLVERALDGGLRDGRLLAARALILESRGDVRGAVAAFQEAVDAAPGDARVLRALARFYVRREEKDAALQVYGLALAAAPGDAALAEERRALERGATSADQR